MTTFKNYPLHGGIVLLFVLLLGCSDDLGLRTPEPQITSYGTSPQLDVSRQVNIDLAAFRTLAAQSVAAGMVDVDRFMVPYGKYYLYLNYERMLRDRAWSLTDDFNMSSFDVPGLARSLDLTRLRATYPSSPLPGQISGVSALLNATQLSILNSYCSRMYSARNATDASVFYTATRNGINTTTGLTLEEKVLLLSFIEVGNEFARKYFAGGWSGIHRDLEEAAQAQVNGCTLDWRGIWAGAVVGGVAGAIFGVKAGAAGGTVTFPGLGTATGALAGAVMGFASGYIGGAVSTIAGQLLTTCFRTVEKDSDMTLYCERLPVSERFECVRELLDHKWIYSVRDFI